MSILQTSDVHLGSDVRVSAEGRHCDFCVCGLVAVLRVAAERHPDVFIIAGDFFDHARLDESEIRLAFDLLSSSGIPSVIVPGNHDAHDAVSPYRRIDLDQWAPTVRVVTAESGEYVELLDGLLSIWGRPVVEHVPEFRPLRGASRPERADWFVVVGHGQYSGASIEENWMLRASPITDGDIVDSGADYVALGHRDVPTCVREADPPAWYSGCPVGPKSSGRVLHVLLDEAGIEIVPVRVAALEEGCRDVAASMLTPVRGARSCA